MNIPRSEYPRPQLVREGYIPLNGTWQFQIDNGRSGIARELYKKDKTLSDSILVPFCPESSLSGVGNKDFMLGVWYKRKVNLSEGEKGSRVVIHFGAADYKTILFVNEQKAGEHKGGYSSFEFDITKYLTVGENDISVYVEDDTRDPLIPRGKQSEEYYSHNCDYTRTTGIWQSVWLELTPEKYIKAVNYLCDIDAPSVTMLIGANKSGDAEIKVTYEGRPVGSASVNLRAGETAVTIPLSERHLWELGAGRLYDVEITFGEDKIKSYFGLREISMEGMKFLLNKKSVFQRLVLDQGFYPDGIYTAPNEEALINDIKLSMALGFNGARLHEKVFEERFLYHCDRLGYMVWGEYPNWGLDHTRPDSIFGILPEWLECVERDRAHPSIVGWCPMNETWNVEGRRQVDDVIRLVYKATKAADHTRPVIDTSGNFHVETDIYDYHDYYQDPEEFEKHFPKDKDGYDFYDHVNTWETIWGNPVNRQNYGGEPMFISEYGGIRWSEDKAGWGYGEGPKTEEEFLSRLKGLTDVILDNPNIMGLCYTQLYDVEQEQNGLLTYERRAKFPPEVIAKIFSRKAAIED